MNYGTRTPPLPGGATCIRMATATQTLNADVHLGDPAAVLELLATPGALVDGHFELLSGRHSDRFVAFSRIAEESRALRALASWLLPSLAPLAPDAVIVPRTAGVALGWTLARGLSVPFHLADVDEYGRPDALLAEPDLRAGRVLLVNDVVTTGAGLRGLSALVRAAGANVAGAAWFLTRGEVDVSQDLGAPTARVVSAELDSWRADRCSLCEQDEPLTFGLDLN